MVKGSDIILILVAVIFPPAAAIFVAGCGCDLLINILLTSLGYLPVIYKRMQAEERYGQEGYKYVGNATYASHFLRAYWLPATYQSTSTTFAPSFSSPGSHTTKKVVKINIG
ncbi:hypothetical protein PSHT_16332 [Puccinia striiformis]|uniref:Uncharacterized protein n=1 Tax=Puccinia striiformis TaxID=27350 RepID=A0A2S4UAH1_9BASI|nr:hypothetical protein PSHT_16332 [Puccinia striiformis]